MTRQTFLFGYFADGRSEQVVSTKVKVLATRILPPDGLVELGFYHRF